jgi:hypothetical protein
VNMIMNLLAPQNAGNVFTSGETLASHTGLCPVQLVNSFLILVSSSSNVYLATLLRNFISIVSTLFTFSWQSHISVLRINSRVATVSKDFICVSVVSHMTKFAKLHL